MSSSPIHMKQPPWRYVAATVALFGLVVVFLATQHSSSAESQDVLSATTHAGTDIFDDIFNTTLGVCPKMRPFRSLVTDIV